MNSSERKSKVESLHHKAKDVAVVYRKAETELLTILQELDDLKGYFDLGCKSLFEYAVQELKLSESTSYALIGVARKSKEVPGLKQALEKSEITLSHAKILAPI